MTVGQALFSFKGRMSRSDYWLKGYLVLLLFGGLSGMILETMLAKGVAEDVAYGVFRIISVFIFPWPFLALVIKRLHDRNRSGWFMLIYLIPVVGTIWLSIEVPFLRGTVGPNLFGDDPVQDSN